MKKRNPAILTEEDWEKVELWLKRIPKEKKLACPWRVTEQRQDKKCAALFPKLEPRGTLESLCGYRCPCHVYSLKYVVRIAKQLLLQKRRQAE